ncbi:MAG: hypothetical protein ACREKE_03115 [bacterium]
MTATPTDTVSDSPTDTPSYTATFTATSSTSPSDTPTISFTATDSASPTDTGTFTPTATQTMTLSDTPTFTGTPTPSATPTASDTRTVTPTETPTASFTASPTITPTPVPAPNQVSIGIYNSAGELVRTVFSGPSQFVPLAVSLSASVLQAGSGGASSAIGISVGGYLTLPGGGQVLSVSWNGTDNNGQGVAGGVYTLLVTTTDSFAKVTTLDSTIQVEEVAPRNSLAIYNSAGEQVSVLTLPQPAAGAAASYAGLELPSNTYAPVYDPVSGQVKTPFVLDVMPSNSGAAVPALWNGTNAQGLPVASGEYTAQLIFNPPQGSQIVLAKTFELFASSAAALSGVVAAPNPALLGAPFEVFYNPVPPTDTVVGLLYNLLGRRVESVSAKGNGSLIFQSGHLASGIYIVVLELDSPGSSVAMSRVTLKVAVVR